MRNVESKHFQQITNTFVINAVPTNFVYEIMSPR